MEPTMMFRLGQIRQQEILESCQRDRWTYEGTGLIASLRERLFSAINARNERPRAPQPVSVEYVDYSDKFAPTR